MFDPKSRYSDPSLKDETYVRADGRCLAYRSLRTIPRPDAPVQVEVLSNVGERPDQIADRTLGDSELAWRLFDANVVMDPLTLPTLLARPWRVPSL